MIYLILALITIGNRPRKLLNCGSPNRDFEVKTDRFQIKQNVLNLKSTLHIWFGYNKKLALLEITT